MTKKTVKTKEKINSFRAANDWIIVDPFPVSRETSVGVIAVIEERKQYSGIVISCGPGVDIEMNPGDTIIWGKWEGTLIRVENKDYTAIRCSDAILVGSAR